MLNFVCIARETLAQMVWTEHTAHQVPPDCKDQE